VSGEGICGACGTWTIDNGHVLRERKKERKKTL